MTLTDRLRAMGVEGVVVREYEEATSDWDRTADRRALNSQVSPVFRVMDHADAALEELVGALERVNSGDHYEKWHTQVAQQRDEYLARAEAAEAELKSFYDETEETERTMRAKLAAAERALAEREGQRCDQCESWQPNPPKRGDGYDCEHEPLPGIDSGPPPADWCCKWWQPRQPRPEEG